MSLDMRVYRLSRLDDDDIQHVSKKDIEDLKKDRRFLVFDIEQDRDMIKHILSYLHIVRKATIFYDMEKILEMCLVPPDATLLFSINDDLHVYEDSKGNRYEIGISNIQNPEDFIYEKYTRYGIVKISYEWDILEPYLRDPIKEAFSEEVVNGGYCPLNDAMISILLGSDFSPFKERDFEFQEGSIVCYEEDY